MSIDIDMKSFAGESAMAPTIPNDSAAVSQPVVDTNSYLQEAEEFPAQKELMDQPVESAKSTPEAVKAVQPEPEINPQAEHFRQLRGEVDRIKAERETEKREHQLQLDMLRANLAPRPEPQRENKFLNDMKEDDIPNVGELRREWERKESGYQERLEELQVAQQHPDYAEVLEKYVVPLIKQKPHLAEGIQGSRNKALFAYELGKMAQQMQAPQQQAQAPMPQPVTQVSQALQAAPTKNENAQRIVENSKKPGTLSQAGGQGALSKADYYSSMSDAEFMKFAGKNLEGI